MRRALLACLLVPGVAHADLRGLAERAAGVAWLHYELTGLERVDDTPRPGLHELVLAGARLHGMISPNSWISYHVGLDVAGGATVRHAGFAYDVALFPVGAAVRLGETSLVALGGGIGAMGAVGTLDDAVTFPVELTVELGRSVRVLARARATFLAAAAGRDTEYEAAVALRLGHGYDEHGFPSGNGYFGGVALRELEGARFVGVTLGYSIDLATPRHGHIELGSSR